MATTTFTDLSMRKNRQSKGVMRTMFDRVMEGRERQVRRYIAQNYALYGLDFEERTYGSFALLPSDVIILLAEEMHVCMCLPARSHVDDIVDVETDMSDV